MPDFVRPFSFSFQVLGKAGFRDPDRPGQRYFCEVVAVKAGDVCVIRCCERVLRLNNFYIVRNSRTEPIARLLQRLSSELDSAFLDRDLLRGRLQIEISIANLLIDLGSQVFEYLLCSLERGIGAQNVAVHSSALKNGDAERHSSIDSAVGGSRINSGDSVVGDSFNRWITFRKTRFFVEFG